MFRRKWLSRARIVAAPEVRHTFSYAKSQIRRIVTETFPHRSSGHAKESVTIIFTAWTRHHSSCHSPSLPLADEPHAPRLRPSSLPGRRAGLRLSPEPRLPRHA